MPSRLPDTSAWNRANAAPELSARWADLVTTGDLGMCPPVRLELLFSATSPSDYASFADELSALRTFPLTSRAIRRAEDVQAALALDSQHRGPSAVDLYVAAIAELSDLVLVHYDRHFDAIARVTGQPVEWIAPLGTLD